MCFIDPSDSLWSSTHGTDEILPRDLQGAVTSPRMKRGDDDNTITGSQPYL